MAIEHEVPEPTLGIYSGSGSSSLFWAKTFTVHFFCIDFRQFGHIFTFPARSRMMTNTSLNFVFLLPIESRLPNSLAGTSKSPATLRCARYTLSVENSVPWI